MAHKELNVKEWQVEITRGLAYQKLNANVSSWEQAREFYMNKYADDVISVNLIFAIGRALVPQLYFKAPTVLIQPDKREMAEFAPVLEAIDRKLITQMGMKQQIKLGILDAYLCNLAVFKFGYHSIGTELPNQKDVEEEGTATDDVLAVLKQLSPELVKEGKEGKGKGKEDNLISYSYHDFVRPNSPWMLRVNPEDLIVPWGTIDIHSAPWCAFRVIRPLVDVQSDPVYKNTKNLKANTTMSPPKVDKDMAAKPTLYKGGVTGLKGEGRGNESEAPHNALEFYEVWDKRTGSIYVLTLDDDLFLRKEKHNLNIQGLPVEILQFNPTGWNFWGTTDVNQIVQQQMEYNETRTMEMKHKKISMLKIVVNGQAMLDTEIEKMMDGKISVAKTKDGGDPNRVVKMITPTMSSDLFKISDVIRTDISEILGFSRNQAGEFDVSRRTATEAGIVQRALEIRSDERRDQVADFIAAAFQRKINPIIFEQWTERRSIQVAGKKGWVNFTGDEIKGDYNVTVIADSVVPLSQAQKQQAALQAMQMFRGDPRIDQARLYEWTLLQMEGIGMPPDLLLTEDEFKINQQQQLQQQIIMAQAGKTQPAGKKVNSNGNSKA